MLLALPLLTMPSLVLYAYTPGSFFDSLVTQYMIKPMGIDPAQIHAYFSNQRNGSATASVSVPLETALWNHNPVSTS